MGLCSSKQLQSIGSIAIELAELTVEAILSNQEVRAKFISAWSQYDLQNQATKQHLDGLATAVLVLAKN